MDACIGLIQGLYECRNRGEVVAVVFLDLRKAFDTVNHLLLIRELKALGGSDGCLEWIRSYLTGRSQQTIIPNMPVSASIDISCGVPQGSVLGPLLFVIYINKIVTVLKHASFFMYADDLAIYVSNVDPSIARVLIQEDLDNISRWCDEFRLTINSSKTQVLWCHAEQDNRDFGVHTLMLKGENLKVVKTFNYLGVLIDSTLSFEKQCNKIISSGRLKLKNLRHLKKYMDSELALLMYKTMIMPTLEYGDVILESGPALLHKEVQTVQNHCLRCCLSIMDPRLIRITELHTTCKCTKLIHRRNVNLLGMVHKFASSPDNVMLPTRVLRSNVNRKIKLQRPKGQCYRDSPMYRGMLLWDKLEAKTQNIMDYDAFMETVKKEEVLLRLI